MTADAGIQTPAMIVEGREKNELQDRKAETGSGL